MSEPKTLLKYPEPKSQVSFPAFKTEGEKPRNAVENSSRCSPTCGREKEPPPC